jgi:hypothetical protein
MTVDPSLRRASGVAPGGFSRQPDSLADVLERVLDKGIVIAGDIVVNILDIELLTLKVRLFISSADTAREMGLDWWSRDPFFTGQKQADAVGSGNDTGEIEALQQRIEALEEQLRASRPELAGKPETEKAAEGS